jgi:hypothetical protein
VARGAAALAVTAAIIYVGYLFVTSPVGVDPHIVSAGLQGQDRAAADGGHRAAADGGTAPPRTEGTAPPRTEGTAPPRTEDTAPPPSQVIELKVGTVEPFTLSTPFASVRISDPMVAEVIPQTNKSVLLIPKEVGQT